MATLANQTISSTYDGLIKTSTDQPVPISGVQLLEDGVGNSLALSVGRANQGVTVTGTLTATSISGVLADGVTATTQATSDNSTKVATTAFVKSVVTAEDLDFAGDTGTGAVDLDSQTFTIAGTANEIETSASGQTITIGLPSSVTVGTLNATTLAGTLSTAAQPNITSVGTLSSLAVSGDLTVDTSTLKVDSANNRVGIGTASPTSTLEVATSGPSRIYNKETSVGVTSVWNSSDGSLVQFGTESNHPLLFVTNNTEKVRIDSSGNVGIGTASPFTSSGYRVLDLFESTNGGHFLVRSANVTAECQADEGSGGAYFGTRTNHFLSIRTNTSERMRIDSSGNVGIGTSSPFSTNGTNFEIATSSASFPCRIMLNHTGGGRRYGLQNQVDGALAIVDFTASAERMRIDSSGNLIVNSSSGSIVNSSRSAVSVSTSATVISKPTTYGGLAMVWVNSSGNVAHDLVSYSLSDVDVLASQNISGGPVGRTYTAVNGELKVAMASGTYDVFCSEIRVTTS